MKPEHGHSVHHSIVSQFQNEAWEPGLAKRLDVEQIFILISGILPVEACLCYQVVPLFLDGSRLHLGMVSPDDLAASDYVRRIVSYLNYSLISHPISSDALQSVLSAYLKYSCSAKNLEDASKPALNRVEQPMRELDTRSPARRMRPAPVDRNLQATLIVDSPESLTIPGMTRVTPEQAKHFALSQPPPQFPVNPAPTLSPEETLPAPELEILEPEQGETKPYQPGTTFALADQPSSLDDDFSALAPQGHNPVTLEQSTPSLSPLPQLDLQAKRLAQPIEAIANLPAKELLTELLGRALVGGIGRLYFERQHAQGRVLWSQNGVLQSVLEKVTIPTFRGLINELKRMTRSSLIEVEKPKQVELERMYDQNRILLRFRFIPGDHGEEATLQVLRGAALRFYQQQQISALGRDALSMAKQLQNKVNEIRDRAQADPGLFDAKVETLPALSQLLHHIEEQLKLLQGSNINQSQLLLQTTGRIPEPIIQQR